MDSTRVRLWIWGVRDPNSPILDKGILKANGNFETREQRNALRIISIRVDDLLISGIDVYRVYFKRMKGKFEVDGYEENKATYLGLKLKK